MRTTVAQRTVGRVLVTRSGACVGAFHGATPFFLERANPSRGGGAKPRACGPPQSTFWPQVAWLPKGMGGEHLSIPGALVGSHRQTPSATCNTAYHRRRRRTPRYYFSSPSLLPDTSARSVRSRRRTEVPLSCEVVRLGGRSHGFFNCVWRAWTCVCNSVICNFSLRFSLLSVSAFSCNASMSALFLMAVVETL